MEKANEKENFFREENFDAVVDMVLESSRASFALEGICISDQNFEKIKSLLKES